MVLDFPMIPGIDQSVALTCKKFAHCDSTSADGSSTYTGSSGWSDAVTFLYLSLSLIGRALWCVNALIGARHEQERC